MFDLAGLNDTRGDEPNLVAAALTKSLLESSRSVKVLCVVGEDEIGGSRGKFFEDFMRSLRMFHSDLQRNSLLLVVNKVPKDLFSTLKLDLERDKNELIRSLLAQNRVHFIPPVETLEDQAQHRSALRRKLGELRETPGERLLEDSGLLFTLSLGVHRSLEECFRKKIDASFDLFWERMEVELRGQSAQEFRTRIPSVWGSFIAHMNEQREVGVLVPFSKERYEAQLESFKTNKFKRCCDDLLARSEREEARREYDRVYEEMGLRHAREEQVPLGITLLRGAGTVVGWGLKGAFSLLRAAASAPAAPHIAAAGVRYRVDSTYREGVDKAMGTFWEAAKRK